MVVAPIDFFMGLYWRWSVIKTRPREAWPNSDGAAPEWRP